MQHVQTELLRSYVFYRGDLTETGHALGLPDSRSHIPTPERTLSPAASCVIMALMHSTLLWTSCNKEVTLLHPIHCHATDSITELSTVCNRGHSQPDKAQSHPSKPTTVFLGTPSEGCRVTEPRTWKKFGGFSASNSSCAQEYPYHHSTKL